MADLVIIGIAFPTESNGQIFHQIDTGQVWAYLNSAWSPITGGEASTLDAPISIFINGVNRNANIKLTSVSIKNNITSKVDTASFMFYDHGDYAIRPDVGYQVDIFSYDTNDKIFSGEIIKIKTEDETQGLLQFQYTIQCVDYTKRLAKRLIIEDYTSQKAGDIIKDIIDNYYNEFSYINVEDGPTIDFVSFNYMTGDNCIRKICSLTGYDWYVDYNKDIHFFLPATDYTPYVIFESGDDYTEYIEITADNKYLDFGIKLNGQWPWTDAMNFTIIIPEGNYTLGATEADAGSLCKAIYDAIIAQAYSIRLFMDEIRVVNNKFRIAAKWGLLNDDFKFYCHSGANSHRSMATILGFKDKDYLVHGDVTAKYFEGEYDVFEVPYTRGNYTNLSINKDKSNYKNKIYLQGSSYLEAYTGDIQVADGEQTTFNLAYEPHSPIVISVDTGGGYVVKTHGIDNIDTSGYDFVINYSEKCIRNLDLAKLTAGHIIKTTYYKKIKTIVYEEDTDSQLFIKEIEGGNGIYEYKFNDDTIADLATARDRISAEIDDFKNPLISGSFITNQYGYEAGQILRIKFPSYGFISYALKVQSVIIKPKIPANSANRFYVEYNVQFQSFDRSFDDFLINMYSNSVNKEIVVKGDEKLTT